MTEGDSSRKDTKTYAAGFKDYLSVYTFRYGSPNMRAIWSQESYWNRARKVWVAVANAQMEAGLVTKEQLSDLIDHRGELSVERIFELEKKFGHDVVGAIAEYSEVAPVGGEILHNGLTSEDVLSNVEAIQINEALELVRQRLITTLEAFSEPIDKYKDLVCTGFTHLQAAEPTTLGYRFAKYAQDLLMDLDQVSLLKEAVRGKGIKGPVGTSASVVQVLQGTEMTAQEHEDRVMEQLGIDAFPITDQTYPRKMLFSTVSTLAGIGLSLHRFGLDMQIMQSSPWDEVAEPRRKGQKGSSAMPHKQNPINSENICSLTEDLAGKVASAWMTGGFVTLERTLRDSAGKRSWLPESFLIVDEALMRAEKVAKGLVVHEDSITRNLDRFGPFAASEIILASLVNAGMDRKEAHDILVEHAELAVETIRGGGFNSLKDLLIDDARIAEAIGRVTVEEAFSKIDSHVGDASARCIDFLEKQLYPSIRQ